MKKILVIGASSSKQSINKQFATYVAQQIEDTTSTVLDLNDFEMLIYSIDREKESGVPEEAQRFKALIDSHDAIVLSLAEHNGCYTAAFKNILDWTSRLQKGLWSNKLMFLLSTSPGKRGGATIMNLAKNHLPYMGANIAAHFSLPGFRTNFSPTEGITDTELNTAFQAQFSIFLEALKAENIQA